MSLEKYAFPFRDNPAGARLGGFAPSVVTNAWPAVKKFAGAARTWTRKALAPGGLAGIIMAIVFVIGTDAFLLLMGYIQEMPPVTLSCLIPVVVAAIRWGTMSAVVTAIGGIVVRDADELRSRLGLQWAGNPVELTVRRADGFVPIRALVPEPTQMQSSRRAAQATQQTRSRAP